MCYQFSRSSSWHIAVQLAQEYPGAQKSRVSPPNAASFQSNPFGVPCNCLLPYTGALFKTNLLVSHLLLPSVSLLCFKEILLSLKSKRFSSFRNVEREATFPPGACLTLLPEPQPVCRQNCKSAAGLRPMRHAWDRCFWFCAVTFWGLTTVPCVKCIHA